MAYPTSPPDTVVVVVVVVVVVFLPVALVAIVPVALVVRVHVLVRCLSHRSRFLDEEIFSRKATPSSQTCR